MNNISIIFKERLIENYLEKFSQNDIKDFDEKWKKIYKWIRLSIRGDLNKTKEKEMQASFLIQIFDEILGYSTLTSTDSDMYYQKPEYKSYLDASEADSGLGFFKNDTKDVRAVLELKDAKTDLDKKQNRSTHLTPVEQAFSYANKNGSKCGWVIVSNFIEIRLYKSNSSVEYESFNIKDMDDKAEFLRFYFFLCKDHLINRDDESLIDQLYQRNEELGMSISNSFYKEYQKTRKNLYTNIKENNNELDELLLFTKAQKIMDRFIFICFCEDCGLLPIQTYQKLIDATHNSYSFSKTKLWDELRGLFKSIDQGNPSMHINQYNGGLFREDPELDNLIITDEVLETFTNLSGYDFGSDLNVNILGQIFEQNISDVEEIKNEITGLIPENKGKKKEEGVFYTPYYVTRYIVEQTVGVYLNEKKEELKHSIFKKGPIKVDLIKDSTKRKNTFEFKSWQEFPEDCSDTSEDATLYRRAVKELHFIYWTAYETVLKNIKICDPACGSGAFLNHCFDYLNEEMHFVLEMKQKFHGQFHLYDIDKLILQNNLFGVDINPESVEITKLSLWLKTAKKNQTLTSLDENIKCGNSIVNDPDVAGPLAFDWETEFPEIFNQGGFDVIVGNPPYGATLDQPTKDYIEAHYYTTEYNYDTYKTFLEQGINLLKPGGYLGYITPNTFFTLELGANKLRKFLFDNNTLLRIVELFNVFPSAVVESVITVFKKQRPSDEPFTSICVPRNTPLTSTFLNEGVERNFIQADLKRDVNYIFNYRSIKEAQNLCLEMQNHPRLDTMFKVMTGAKPYQKGKGIPPQTKDIVDNKPFTGYEKKDATWVPYYRGRTIDRYTDMWKKDKEYIKYGKWLAEPRLAEVFAGEKLFIRQTADCLIAMFDKGNVSNNTLHSIYPLKENNQVSLLYLLGVLNSSLMNWYYQTVNYLEVGKPMAEVKGVYIRKLPIAIIDTNSMKKVEVLVNTLSELCQKRFDLKQDFLYYIQTVYGLKKLSDTLYDFKFLSFNEFIIELQKQKVKLDEFQKFDLLPLYDKQKSKIAEITAQIKEAQAEVDDIIFSAYKIPEHIRKAIVDV